MKRPIIASLLLSVALALPGCPIYDDQGCSIDSQCAPGYQCQRTTGDCVAPDAQGPTQECYKPGDCPNNGTCDRTGSCRSVDCSWDDVGCVAGYVCTRQSGVWRCEAEGSAGGSSGGEASYAGASAGGASGAGGMTQGGAPSGGASGAAGAAEGGSAGQSAGGQSSGGQGTSGQGAGGV